jgi:hypothetical protein
MSKSLCWGHCKSYPKPGVLEQVHPCVGRSSENFWLRCLISLRPLPSERRRRSDMSPVGVAHLEFVREMFDSLGVSASRPVKSTLSIVFIMLCRERNFAREVSCRIREWKLTTPRLQHAPVAFASAIVQLNEMSKKKLSEMNRKSSWCCDVGRSEFTTTKMAHWRHRRGYRSHHHSLLHRRMKEHRLRKKERHRHIRLIRR